MRIVIYVLIIFIYTNGIAQEEFISKRPVFSFGCQNRYVVIPYNFSIGIASNNLKNQISLSYNIGFVLTGFQFGYQRYFFNTRGIHFGVNYIQSYGKFNYVDPNTKSYKFVTNLNMFKAEIGYYFRLKMHYFGIFEPSITISYQYPINSNSKIIFKDDFEFRPVMLNLNLRYYFKRNKTKNGIEN
jgi:hypothetical protein